MRILLFVLLTMCLSAKADLINSRRVNIKSLFPRGTNGYVLTTTDNGTDIEWTSAGSGTVSSVAIAGDNGALSTGGPITSSGTITVSIDQGQVLVPGNIGSSVQSYDADLATIAGLTPANGQLIYSNNAAWALLENGADNYVLTVNGANIGWEAGSSGTVTSVAIAGDNGALSSGGPITTSGTITLSIDQGQVLVPGNIGSSVQAYSANLDTLSGNNGSNLTGVDATTLDTIDSGSFLRSDASDTFTGSLLTLNGNGAFAQSAYFNAEIDDGNSSTADTIDWRTGNHHKSTLTGNVTYTFTAPGGATTLTLKLVQDATGSRTATWPATVKWPGGTAPTLTTTAAAVDFVSCYYDGTNYYCSNGLDFQ